MQNYRRMGKDKEMRYALIGCGRISPNHIEAAKNNRLDFVAMCDVIPDVMQEKSDRFDLQAVRKYTDYKKLIEKEKPDLVAIATESGEHATIALDCIAAGCNLIVEKPIALSMLVEIMVSLSVQAIRIDLINQYNIFAKHLRQDVLVDFLMVQRMSDGIEGKAIMIRHHGVGPGLRMAVVL